MGSRNRKSRSRGAPGRRSTNPNPLAPTSGAPQDSTVSEPSVRRWLHGGSKWVVAALLTAMVGAAFSPIYLPRLMNIVNPSRSPVDINVQPVPRGAPSATASSSPSPSPSPESGSVGILRQTHIELGHHSVFRSELQQRDLDLMSKELKRYSGQGPEALDGWLKSRGAADAGTTALRLTLQGIDQKVSIAGMRAVIRERSALFDGGLLFNGLGGEESPIVVNLQLDGPTARAPYFTNHVITIGQDETATVDLYAVAARSFVSWDLEIDFVVAGKTRSTVVQPPYGHFRTSAIPDAPDGNLPEHYDYRAHYKALASYTEETVEFWSPPAL
jgi:hypothetical protein